MTLIPRGKRIRTRKLLVAALLLAGVHRLDAGVVSQDAKTAPAALAQADSAFPRGEITEVVVTRAEPGQSYALYLPSHYDPNGRWPLVIAFDPGARGKVPVELFAPAAEKYGYIVVGSHNSRNGPLDIQMEAFRHLWNDVLTRFPIDDKRIYTAGFSGGARAATLAAQLCPGCIAGVIGCGAGFSLDFHFTRDISFVYFSAVGLYDFNYPELAHTQQTLDALGIPNVRRVFEGGHQWAPPEVLTEAIEWMQLQAMARGQQPREETFIEAQWARAEAAARSYEEQGNPAEAYRAYKVMLSAFRSLKDMTAVAARAQQLEATKEVRKALKKEARQIEEQLALTRPLVAQLDTLRTASSTRMFLLAELRTKVGELRRRREREKDADELAVLRRALGEVFAAFYEAAQDSLRQRDHQLAVVYLQVAAEVAPQNHRVEYNIACAYALAGHKKEALAALRRAVEKGFADPTQMEADKNLDSLRNTAEYKSILQTLAAKAQP